MIDFEAIFEKKVRRYMKENAGKYTEEEWEERIPLLFDEFGDSYLEEAGATPREYFAKMTNAELCSFLSSCVREKIALSDFLLRELEGRDLPEELLSLIEEGDEEVTLAALDAAGEGERAGELFFRILTGDYPAAVKEVAALKFADFPAKDYLDRAIECCQAGRGEVYMLDFLSSSGIRDERILGLLSSALNAAGDDLPVVAGFAARYGDERLLGLLLQLIDREETGYIAYRELLLAIEALGGSYDKKRDFSADKDFMRIKADAEQAKQKRS